MKALAELTFALEAEGPDNERVQLALILQRLAERSLETTFVSNLPSSLGIKSNSESCNARLIQWAQEELEGILILRMPFLTRQTLSDSKEWRWAFIQI